MTFDDRDAIATLPAATPRARSYRMRPGGCWPVSTSTPSTTPTSPASPHNGWQL